MSEESKDMTIYVTDSGVPMGLEGFQPKQSFGNLKRDSITGEIEYTSNGERREEWDVIFTNAWYEKALFTGGFGDGAKPECKTHNKTLNKSALEGTVYGPCEFCPNNQWADGPDGKRIPPKCKDSLALAGWLDSGRTQPFVLRLSGKSMKVGEAILQDMFDHMQPLFQFAYKIRLGELQGTGIKWRDWIIEKGTNLEEVNKDLMSELGCEYVERTAKLNSLLPGQDAAESLADGVSAEEVAELMGGEIIEEGEVVTGKEMPKEMPADFGKKELSQEEQVKNGTIPFAS
jgi:hypothetical protein